MYIIDIEASSLSPNSYPIEIAFGRDKNTVWTSLINPEYIKGWDDWDMRSQNVHGIARDTLLLNGKDPRWVAKKVVDCLAGQEVYSDEPRYDGMWTDRLLMDSGYDPCLIKIKDLKKYMTRMVKCSIHHRRFNGFLQAFGSGNRVMHRAKDDVIWLFDFLEFLKTVQSSMI